MCIRDRDNVIETKEAILENYSLLKILKIKEVVFKGMGASSEEIDKLILETEDPAENPKIYGNRISEAHAVYKKTMGCLTQFKKNAEVVERSRQRNRKKVTPKCVMDALRKHGVMESRKIQAMFGCSSSSLSKDLAAYKTSYTRLLDNYRLELADNYIKRYTKQNVPVSIISTMRAAGYRADHNTDPFRLLIKRATGLTVKQYIEQAIEEAKDE